METFADKIKKEEYLKDVFYVAKELLLGAYLCSSIDNKFTVGKITELEVYIGAEDKASHAYPNKKTPRNEVMFEAGGKSYVFFVYGMHNQFNVVTSPKNTANAILIRSLEPVFGIEIMKERRKTDNILNLTTGPGKLCKALAITREHNALDLTGNTLWISPKSENVEVIADKRIGIDYAKEYKDKPWRFMIKNNKFISKKPSSEKS
ncbi:MAG: DNA-3-methyladenine glycosylase [Lactobacillaceae bacterium]|nr:DNA-3-methyladenine glycosylase [Lactobacillaceae bacterium]